MFFNETKKARKLTRIYNFTIKGSNNYKRYVFITFKFEMNTKK